MVDFHTAFATHADWNPHKVQRNPQYSVPSGQGPVSPEYRQKINADYPEIWKEAVDGSLFAFGFKEVSRSTFSVDEAERRQIYEKAWNTGGGFRFMFSTFGDISTDEVRATRTKCMSDKH